MINKEKDNEKEEVVRCGWKSGAGAGRDQTFEKNYAKNSRCHAEHHADGGMHGVEVGDRKSESYTRQFDEGGYNKKPVKRDMGGPIGNHLQQNRQMHNPMQNRQMANPMQNRQMPIHTENRQMPSPMQKNNPVQNMAPPQNSAPSQGENGAPVNINYGLKKGGKASLKSVVKKFVSKDITAKAIKLPKVSAALIESISIMPKAKKETKNEHCHHITEKAVGGAAKIRQDTFGSRANPPIKR